MQTAPANLPASLLAETISRHWNLPAITLTHLPVGFGSHHWQADAVDGRGWFVTVDDHEHGHLGFGPETSFQELDRAMRTVATLRDAIGLEFVVGPLPDREGNVLLRLEGPQDHNHNHYSVAIFPLLDSERTGFGRIPESQRQATLRLIGRLHKATPSLPAGLPWRDDLQIAQRRDLEAALNDLDTPWTGGPYAEPTRHLLREHRENITQALRHYDELAAAVAADPAPWVVTHGEPHAGNVVRLRTGALRLVDWDTVALAPKERDLWMLTADGATDWTPYHDVVGKTSVSETALSLYRLRWDLADIAAYVFWFRRPHEDSDDMRTGWEGLNGYLPLTSGRLD